MGMPVWRNGRRIALKMRRFIRAGSSPATGTILEQARYRLLRFLYRNGNRPSAVSGIERLREGAVSIVLMILAEYDCFT